MICVPFGLSVSFLVESLAVSAEVNSTSSALSVREVEDEAEGRDVVEDWCARVPEEGDKRREVEEGVVGREEACFFFFLKIFAACVPIVATTS
jgi:hypothetical protein